MPLWSFENVILVLRSLKTMIKIGGVGVGHTDVKRDRKSVSAQKRSDLCISKE